MWSIHLKPAGYDGALRHAEAVPLVIGNTMYVTSPYGAILALDATTGEEQWRFELPENDLPAKRGLAYWPGDGNVPPSLFFGTILGELYSIQAANGALNP